MPYAAPSPIALPVPAAGLPAWTVVRLDEALAAGVLHADQLDGLKPKQLTALARALVRAGYGDGFDAATALADLPT